HLDYPERAQPAGRLTLCLPHDHRRRHSCRYHDVEFGPRETAAFPQGERDAPMTGLTQRLRDIVGPEMAGPVAAFVAVVVIFGIASPQFLSQATFGSVAFQLPELGLLTLAMLLPILTGGLNLAVTFTANIAGL